MANLKISRTQVWSNFRLAIHMWQPAVAHETAPQKHMESTWALGTLRQNSEAGVAFTSGIQFTWLHIEVFTTLGLQISKHKWFPLHPEPQWLSLHLSVIGRVPSSARPQGNLCMSSDHSSLLPASGEGCSTHLTFLPWLPQNVLWSLAVKLGSGLKVGKTTPVAS